MILPTYDIPYRASEQWLINQWPVKARKSVKSQAETSVTLSKVLLPIPISTNDGTIVSIGGMVSEGAIGVPTWPMRPHVQLMPCWGNDYQTRINNIIC